MKYSLMLFVSALLLNACSSTNNAPTFGNALLNEAAKTKALGEEWNKGNTLISQGQRMKKKGARMISDGDQLIKRGKAMKARVEASSSS